MFVGVLFRSMFRLVFEEVREVLVWSGSVFVVEVMVVVLVKVVEVVGSGKIV